MERLINLLNEYDKEIGRNENRVLSNETYIISKKFGFIKWLSENKETYFLESDYGKHHFEGDNYEDIIMLLSIMDKPLEFLSSLYH